MLFACLYLQTTIARAPDPGRARRGGERGKRQKRGWGEMDVKRSCSSSTPSAEGSRRRKASNNNSSGTSTAAVERKEIERKRRQHMKSLCLKLASLIPKEHFSKVPHSPLPHPLILQ